MKFLSVISYVFLVFCAPGCGNGVSQQTEQPEVQYTITNVHVIPMDSEIILENQTVLISNGKFSAIGDVDKVEIPENTVVIDGSGKFLLPGLAEMHAHIPGNQNMELLEETLFLYLSNGITTIRGMLGQPYHLELREKAVNNDILSPRIFTSGPSLNGNSVKTVSDAREKVTAHQESGYDFLKLHPGLTLENFNEIVKTANEVGITFSGHVSIDVGVRRALEAKYASIDHIDGYLEGLVPEDAGADPSQNGFFGYNFTDIADRNLIPELAKMTKDAGVWVVPTQSLMERWAGTRTPEELADEPEMKYVAAKTRDNWIKTVSDYQNRPEFNREKAARFNQLRRDIIKALHNAGAGLLLGSDAPQIFNVPGFSIQHELQYMIKSGLTPYEALKMGTINPALFFNKEGEFGVIKTGASADFLLLDANPLDDIDHVQTRSGVMVRGVWLPEEEIQKRLDRIAAKYAEQ